MRPEEDNEDRSGEGNQRRWGGGLTNHTDFTVLNWWLCSKAVWSFMEREMMIMEMSKLSLWKIKQAADCFYITFIHWHTGLLCSSLPHFQTHTHVHPLVSLLCLLSRLCKSALSLTSPLFASSSDTHQNIAVHLKAERCCLIHQNPEVETCHYRVWHPFSVCICMVSTSTFWYLNACVCDCDKSQVHFVILYSVLFRTSTYLGYSNKNHAQNSFHSCFLF